MNGSFYFNMIAEEQSSLNVFRKLLQEDKITYKTYVAWHTLDIKRKFFKEDNQYKSRKVKWAIRYLKKHGHTMEEFDKLIQEDINEMKGIASSVFSNLYKKEPAVANFLKRYLF